MAFDLAKFLRELNEALERANKVAERKERPAPEMVTKEYHDHALREADRRFRGAAEENARHLERLAAKLQKALGHEGPRKLPLDQLVEEVVRTLDAFKQHKATPSPPLPEPSTAHVFNTPEKKVESMDNYVRDLERQQRADEALIAKQAREIESLNGQLAEAREMVELCRGVESEARYEPNNTGNVYNLIAVTANGAVKLRTVQGQYREMLLSQWLTWEVVE